MLENLIFSTIKVDIYWQARLLFLQSFIGSFFFTFVVLSPVAKTVSTRNSCSHYYRCYTPSQAALSLATVVAIPPLVLAWTHTITDQYFSNHKTGRRNGIQPLWHTADEKWIRIPDFFKSFGPHQIVWRRTEKKVALVFSLLFSMPLSFANTEMLHQIALQRRLGTLVDCSKV